jgi:hypothetical protein
MKPFHLPEFDPKTIRPCSTHLAIGARNMGKSVLIRDLLYHMRHMYDFGMSVCGSLGAYNNVARCMPKRMIFNGYSESAIKAFAETLKEMNADGKKRSGLLVEDDLLSVPNYLKTPTQMSLYMDGKHYFSSKISALQFALGASPALRGNIDYVYLTREPVLANKKRLFDYVVTGFDTFKEFCKVFDECTKAFQLMVIDRTRTDGQNVFWYRANPDIPPFTFGRPIYFTLSRFIEEENEKAKRRQRNENLKTLVI